MLYNAYGIKTQKKALGEQTLSYSEQQLNVSQKTLGIIDKEEDKKQ